MGNCVLCKKTKSNIVKNQIEFEAQFKQIQNISGDKSSSQICRNCKIKSCPIKPQNSLENQGIQKNNQYSQKSTQKSHNSHKNQKHCVRNTIDAQKKLAQSYSFQKNNNLQDQDELPINHLKMRRINSKSIDLRAQKNAMNDDIVHMISNLSIDLSQKFGIRNLPQQWATKLQASGIKYHQAKQHPDVVIDLIKSQQLSYKNSSIIYPLISSEQFQSVIDRVQIRAQNPGNTYKIDKKLGSGAMCQVFKASKIGQNGKQYAVRVMKIQNKQALQKIKQQIAIMKLCESENIVKHVQTYYYQNLASMLIQYMNWGSLTQFIEVKIIKQSEMVPQYIISFIIKEILKGLKVLHSKKRMHRDLKSDNVLINQSGLVKIGDFGFATQLTREKQRRNTLVGTPYWMAPQLIRKSEYNQKVDIWSIGIILYEMIYGQPPFMNELPLKAMYLIASSNAPSIQKNEYSQNLKNFSKKCLIKNPHSRASCKQLLRHPFLNQQKHHGQSLKKFKEYILNINLDPFP